MNMDEYHDRMDDLLGRLGDAYYRLWVAEQENETLKAKIRERGL